MTFTPEVYEQIRDGARRSAAVIVPLVCDLLDPRYVADVGCGEGWFSRQFAENGCAVTAVDRTLGGIDGVTLVDRTEGSVTFLQGDLVNGDAWAYALASVEPARVVARPTVGERGFPYDLVVCLEVAEHLAAGAADAFVATLCALAPVVLFSAAVPGQGGHGHVNEQWPAYWASRFETHDRHVSGALRWIIWGDDQVEPWYQQNLLVAATDVAVADVGERAEFIDAPTYAAELFSSTASRPIPVVHPTTFSYWVEIAKARA